MKKSILIAFFLTIRFSDFMHGSDSECERKKEDVINLMLFLEKNDTIQEDFLNLMYPIVLDAFETCMKDRYSDYISWNDQKNLTHFKHFCSSEIAGSSLAQIDIDKK
jgi:hypothetical protein